MEYNTFGRFNKESLVDSPKKLQKLEQEVYHKHESFAITENKKSLANHEDVLKLAKIMIPILLILTEGNNIYCCFFTGAKIQGFTSLTGEYFTIFDIDFYKIVASLWDENQYFMSFMLCVCSGIWPHIKSIAMAFCWFTPQKYLNFKWREYILLFLDGFGKWAYINTYLIMIQMCSFKYSIQKNGDLLDIAITPQPIFYLFIGGTMLQSIMTHVMLHQHRQSVELDSNDEKHILIAAHIDLFERKTILGHEGGFFKRHVVPVILFCALIIFSFAYFLDCFDFNFEGIVGAITLNDPNQSYSPWDVGYNIPRKSYHPHQFLIVFLQILFFLTTFVTPFIFLVFTLILFTVPMRIQVQNYIYYITEVLFSWSSIEVFAFSVFSTVVETQPFVRISLGDSLEGANQILAFFQKLFPEIIKTDEIYKVDSYMLKQSAPLFVLIFIILFIGIYVLRLAQIDVEGTLVDIGIRKQDAWKQNKRYYENSELESNSEFNRHIEDPLLNVQQSGVENSAIPKSEIE